MSNLFFLPTDLFTGFDILGWKFTFSRTGKFLALLSSDNVRAHKLKMKIIVKRSHLNLNKLNALIYDWSNLYGSADFNRDLFGSLDVYLYKLLWNWAKRRHPRRPHTWIYTRYWKFVSFLNCWSFYLFDYSLGRCLFLNMHSIIKSKFFCVPASLNTFDFRNYNKLGLNWIKKCCKILCGLTLCLYKSQYGRCFCCGKFFTEFGRVNLKFSFIRKNSSVRFVLIHTVCKALKTI